MVSIKFLMYTKILIKTLLTLTRMLCYFQAFFNGCFLLCPIALLGEAVPACACTREGIGIQLQS